MKVGFSIWKNTTLATRMNVFSSNFSLTISVNVEKLNKGKQLIPIEMLIASLYADDNLLSLRNHLHLLNTNTLPNHSILFK